jgi:hypothetical protein
MIYCMTRQAFRQAGSRGGQAGIHRCPKGGLVLSLSASSKGATHTLNPAISHL